MNGPEVAIGSRGSALALAQAQQVQVAFEREGQASRVVVIETAGDRRAPDTAWGEGAFVAAIERALLAGRVDIAVHSAKDVPTREDPRLRIGAYLQRADPRDALVVPADATARRLDDLPRAARVGTDSPRRMGFLLARRADLTVHPLHGNVDTRLRRLDSGETDALVLAAAGLDRLGLSDRIAERLEPTIVPPAPGQGAIAVQARSDDPRTLALLARLDDAATRLAVEVERAFLSASGGGCRSPIGALATVDGEDLVVLGGYARTDGSDTVVRSLRGPVAEGASLARKLAAELDACGGLSRTWRITAGRVLVTRAAAQADDLVWSLRQAGLEAVRVPTIAVELGPTGGELDAAARHLDAYAWVIITSANGARAILDAADRTTTSLYGPAWAAIGPVTRTLLERGGIEIAFEPGRSNGVTLAADVPIATGDRVLVVRGDLADQDVVLALRARGAKVDDVIGYRTLLAPEDSGPLLRRALEDGPFDAVVFTSGSTVRGFVALAGAESLPVISIPAVCIGPETAAEAQRMGFRVVGVATTRDAAALATATTAALAGRHQEMR